MVKREARSRCVVAGSVAVFLGASLSGGEQAAAASPGAPQVGALTSIRVQLENLPKRYSCADLTTITTQVLEAVGIKSGLRVGARRCERALGSNAKSPVLNVTFGKAVTQPIVTGAGIRVKIGAGAPPVLKESDCELLRQLYFRLLSRLDLDVREYSLACMLPPHARPSFHITVEKPKTSDVLTTQSK